jgi:hypothetical protein
VQVQATSFSAIGPAKQNSHHSRVQNGYDLSAFKTDWKGQFAICPQDKKSAGWWSAKSPTGRVSIHTKFSRTEAASTNDRSFLVERAVVTPDIAQVDPNRHLEPGLPAWDFRYEVRRWRGWILAGSI